MNFPGFLTIKPIRFWVAGSIFFIIIALDNYASAVSADPLDDEQRLLDLYYSPKDLVVFSSKRHPQPLSEVAENMSVITSETIRDMNARTLGGILKRIPGFFITFDQDIHNTITTSVEGAEQRHILVLVDGISWNALSTGVAQTRMIPADIIERIEVIKGPASSVWGSSLGGVINVITKSAASRKSPEGSVQARWGESGSQSYSVQMAGKSGAAAYYLFGLRDIFNTPKRSDNTDTSAFYSKISFPLFANVIWQTTLGHIKYDIDYGDVPSFNIYGNSRLETLFGTTSLNMDISPSCNLQASAYILREDDALDSYSLGVSMWGDAGDVYKQLTEKNKKIGGHAEWVLRHGSHKAVLGIEGEKGALDRYTSVGPKLQTYGIPAEIASHPDIEQWAVFLNDTITWGRYSISPGIRFDYNDITGRFISPSLGITRRMGENSLLRVSVSRGFTIPPLMAMSGGALLLDANSDLDSEEMWSYQAGFETTALRYLWLKGTVFYHDLDNALFREPQAGGPPDYNDMIVNNGKEDRRGIGIESETTSFYNVTLAVSISYINILNDTDAEKDKDDVWSGKIGVRYDNHDSFQAELFGHYFRWDYVLELDDKYETFLWDFNCRKKIGTFKNIETELFATVHNLFDGYEYNSDTGRWLEAGIRFNF